MFGAFGVSDLRERERRSIFSSEFASFSMRRRKRKERASVAAALPSLLTDGGALGGRKKEGKPGPKSDRGK